MSHEVIFKDAVTTLESGGSKIFDCFRKRGLVVLKGLLSKNKFFEDYRADLSLLFETLLKKQGETPSARMELQELIARVFEKDNFYPRYVHDLGTHPMKLLSGNLLKYQDLFVKIVRGIFGPQAILASPTGSDNLLFFFPGEKFEKYNLPMHQDFPYIMQSAAQLTIWIPLTPRSENVGGFRGHLGSQALGICKNRETARGMEVAVTDAEVANYPLYEIDWELGDVVFMNSLLLHQSIPNVTQDKVRAIQIYRFSDLATSESASYFWQSTNYTSPKGSIKFDDVYGSLLIK